MWSVVTKLLIIAFSIKCKSIITYYCPGFQEKTYYISSEDYQHHRDSLSNLCVKSTYFHDATTEWEVLIWIKLILTSLSHALQNLTINLTITIALRQEVSHRREAFITVALTLVATLLAVNWRLSAQETGMGEIGMGRCACFGAAGGGQSWSCG